MWHVYRVGLRFELAIMTDHRLWSSTIQDATITCNYVNKVDQKLLGPTRTHSLSEKSGYALVTKV